MNNQTRKSSNASLHLKNIKKLTSKYQQKIWKKPTFFIIFSCVVLACFFGGKYAYNHYFFYKIPVVYTDVLNVMDSSNPDVIWYQNEEVVAPGKKGKRLFYWNDLWDISLKSISEKSSHNIASYHVYNDTIRQADFEKKMQEVDSNALKKNIDVKGELIGNVVSIRYGNYGANYSIYKNPIFKKLNSLVSHNTLVAKYFATGNMQHFFGNDLSYTEKREKPKKDSSLFWEEKSLYLAPDKKIDALKDMKDITTDMKWIYFLIDVEGSTLRVKVYADTYTRPRSDRELKLLGSIIANKFIHDGLKKIDETIQIHDENSSIEITFDKAQQYVREEKYKSFLLSQKNITDSDT